MKTIRVLIACDVDDLANAIGYVVQDEEWEESAISTLRHAREALQDYIQAGRPGYGDMNTPTASQYALAKKLFKQMTSPLPVVKLPPKGGRRARR